MEDPEVARGDSDADHLREQRRRRLRLSHHHLPRGWDRQQAAGCEDVAQTVTFALNVPHHVNLDRITLRPVAQASQFKVIRAEG